MLTGTPKMLDFWAGSELQVMRKLTAKRFGCTVNWLM